MEVVVATVAALVLVGGLVTLWNALNPEHRHVYPMLARVSQPIMERVAGGALSLPKDCPMVEIPSGTFMMGTPKSLIDSQKGYSDEIPHHQVTLTRCLKVATHPVTQRLWERLMGDDQKHRYEEHSGRKRPIVNVTWYEAIYFCNRLSNLAGLESAYEIDELSLEPRVVWNESSTGYRLPTEAEWEYFCRAGSTTAFWSGETPYDLRASEWTGDDADELPKVARKLPNPWGLYDTNGLVGEWCWDLYGTYDAEPAIDPVGPASGRGRVWRGGRWFWKGRPEYFRSVDRDQMLAVNDDRGVGFRVVRIIADSEKS